MMKLLNAFLIGGLLCLSNTVFGSSSETLTVESEDAWSFEGEFSRRLYTEGILIGRFDVDCHLQDHLKDISCLQYHDGLRLSCKFSEEFLTLHPEFTEKIYKIDPSITFIKTVWTPLNKPFALLKPLYEDGFIPDFVVDRLLSEMKLQDQDFRLTAQRVLAGAQKDLPEGYSFQDLIGTIETQLKGIAPRKHQQQIRWDLMLIVQGRVTGLDADLIEFCSQITDHDLPFYDDSRIMLANLYIAKGGESAREESIKALLHMSNPTAHSTQLLNRLVSLYLNNEEMVPTPLPVELQNLQPGPHGAESVMTLLSYIRDLQNKITE